MGERGDREIHHDKRSNPTLPESGVRDISLAVFQHAEKEGAGLFETLARERGIAVRNFHLHENEDPSPAASTHLLVMGGPMSVNDEDVYPWLRKEKELIREWVTEGRPVLGICLGAQLIASALGAAVHPCVPETGWYPVTTVSENIIPGIPRQFPVFQMHGETFDLPRGAELVFQGEEVRNQGLRVGSALGLQFHVEITPAMIRDWVSDCPPPERDRHLEETQEFLPRSAEVCRKIAEEFFSARAAGFSWR